MAILNFVNHEFKPSQKKDWLISHVLSSETQYDIP